MTSENAEKSTTRWGLITVLAIVAVGVIATLGLIEAWVYSLLMNGLSEALSAICLELGMLSFPLLHSQE